MAKPAEKWLVVAGIALVDLVVSGSGPAVIGPILDAVRKGTGWSNAATSGLASVYTAAYLLSSPMVGIALDRFGARVVMCCGTVLAALGLVLASEPRSWWVSLLAYGIAGLGFNASFYIPSSVVVTSWMGEKRALGMGIVMAAVSVGSTAFSSLVEWWIGAYGWHRTLEDIAFLIAVMWPVILVVAKVNPETQRVPDGRKEQGQRAKRERGLSGKVLSSPVILASASAILFYFGMQGIYFHIVPVLISGGYSAHLAGLAYGATWLVSALGSLGLGLVADRAGVKWTLATALFCGACGTASLLGVSDAGVGGVCVAAFVLLWGAPSNAFGQLAPVLFADCLGLQDLGTVLGVQVGIAGIAGAIAPFVTGLTYDKFGTYKVAIILTAVAALVAGLVILLVGAPSRHRGELKKPSRAAIS